MPSLGLQMIEPSCCHEGSSHDESDLMIKPPYEKITMAKSKQENKLPLSPDYSLQFLLLIILGAGIPGCVESTVTGSDTAPSLLSSLQLGIAAYHLACHCYTLHILSWSAINTNYRILCSLPRLLSMGEEGTTH